MANENLSDDSLIQRVNVGDLLTRTAARTPSRDAVIDRERRFSYEDFEALSNRVAHGLLDLGYLPGDALALMSSNSVEFLATYFACAKLGVVCVPINLLWRNRELGYVLEHARVKGVMVEATFLGQLATGIEEGQKLRDLIVIGTAAGESDATDDFPQHLRLLKFDALQEGQPGDVPQVVVEDRAPLSYLYTSGTTSAPKGVVGSHLAIYLASLGTAIDTRLSGDDRVGAMLPMFHTAQLNAFCTPVVAVGGTLCVMEAFDAEQLLDLIEHEKLSVIFGLPMMYRTLIEAQRLRPRNVTSLRLAVYAMAPMPESDLRKAIDVFDCDFSLMFGQTEMSPVTTFFRPEHQLSHPGAVGTPAVNVQVGIMDLEGKLLPTGESGEIVYRSPQALSGYLLNEEATQEAFRYGWFHSGDAGYFDDDGILWFTDRFKDVIKSGGENIASIEVEKALYEAEPGIAEAVVIGLPHARWTEAVTAVIVPHEGCEIDEEALLARLRARLSPFKSPKSLIIKDKMPKTSTGKIQKALLRNQYLNHYDDTAAS